MDHRIAAQDHLKELTAFIGQFRRLTPSQQEDRLMFLKEDLRFRIRKADERVVPN